MANTYTLISSYTATGSPSTVTFSSIPSTYTDLKLVHSCRTTVASWTDGLAFTMNSTRTTSQKRLYGAGSGVTTDSAVGNGQGEAGFIDGNTATSNTFSSDEIYIPNYLSSNQKSYSQDMAVENNSTTNNLIGMFADLTNMTSAINSLTITAPSGTTFMDYSTFYLYGVKNA